MFYSTLVLLCLYNCLTKYRYNFLYPSNLIPTVLKSQTFYCLFTKKVTPDHLMKKIHTLSVFLIKKHSWKCKTREQFWKLIKEKSSEWNPMKRFTRLSHALCEMLHTYIFYLVNLKTINLLKNIIVIFFLFFQSRGMYLLIQQVVLVVWLC